MSDFTRSKSKISIRTPRLRRQREKNKLVLTTSGVANTGEAIDKIYKCSSLL